MVPPSVARVTMVLPLIMIFCIKDDDFGDDDIRKAHGQNVKIIIMMRITIIVLR